MRQGRPGAADGEPTPQPLSLCACDLPCELTSAVCADPWQKLILQANQIGDAGVTALAEVIAKGGLAQLAVSPHPSP